MKLCLAPAVMGFICVFMSHLPHPAHADGTAPPVTMYRLTAQSQAGELTRVEAHLEVGGDLRFTSGAEVITRPLSVVAELIYDERQLTADAGLQRTLRCYEQAEATIKVDKSALQPQLRDDRRLVLAQHEGGELTLASTQNPLNRDELDLIDMLADPLMLEQLLPTDPVAIGESWNHEAAAMKSLLGLDAVAHCEVESLLAKVEDDVAEVMLAGTVQGAAEGVTTEIQLKARYHFDLTIKQIVGLTLAVKEQRAIGHVGPGLDIVAKLRLKMAPIDSSDRLGDAVAAGLPAEASSQLVRLEHQSGSGDFRFLCDRRWYVTSDEPALVVLRLIDRGDLLAQCNLSPIAPKSAENRISLAQYQIEVKHTLGKNFGRVISAGEWTDSHGQLVYRVTAQGQVDELPIEWRYYLVHHADGRRVAIAFTVEAALASRLGDADRQLVDTLQLLPLPKQPKATAAKSSVQR